MNRLFTTPRGATLNELCDKYKPESKKEKERREEQERRNREKEREKFKDCKHELSVKIVSGEGLAPKDHTGKSDPFVAVAVRGTVFKTEIRRQTLSPEWNDANSTFSFDLRGFAQDFRFTDLELLVMDWDRLGSNEFMGQVKIPMREIRNELYDSPGLWQRKTLRCGAWDGRTDTGIDSKGFDGAAFSGSLTIELCYTEDYTNMAGANRSDALGTVTKAMGSKVPELLRLRCFSSCQPASMFVRTL